MDILNSLFSWISANPGLAGLGVFLIAFFESLALVGLVLPGAAMMFGIGALVGGGALPLWPTLLWAAAGAIAGDGVSFWLGRRYHMRLKTLWPLRNHPELIASATHFFYRHGGKSILLGRFIGPIRPVIPAVAGMLEMPPLRFVVFNVVSGLLWAPVYIFPGMLFATSLGLASEVAASLAVAIGTLLGVVFLVLWLLHRLFERLHRHAYPLLQRTLAWARLHPLVGAIPASLLDPSHPEARGLTLLALLLFAASTLFAVVVHASAHEGLLLHLDSYLLLATEALRTPFMNVFFARLLQLGEWPVLLPVTAVVLAWLWLRGYHHAARHWSSAIALGALLSLNLLWLEGRAQVPFGATLHSGQLMTAIAVYGFLTILIARELPERRRWYIYAPGITLLLGIALAQLYFGAARLTGVLGAMTLGLAWVSLLGIGYRNHPAERLAAGRLAGIAMLTLLLSAGGYAAHQGETTLQRHMVETRHRYLERESWWLEGWRELPAYRADLRGYNNHPLNLQYAGALPQLEQALGNQGWQRRKAVNALNWLTWLSAEAPLEQIPVLPQVHDGQQEVLSMVRLEPQSREFLALRLWPTPYRLEDGSPLWQGNVTRLELLNLGSLTVPRTRLQFDAPLQQLGATPLSMEKRRVVRESELDGWSGEVILLQGR